MTTTPLKSVLIARDEAGDVRLTVREIRHNSEGYTWSRSRLLSQVFASVRLKAHSARSAAARHLRALCEQEVLSARGSASFGRVMRHRLAWQVRVPTLAASHPRFEHDATESLATPAPAEIRRDQRPPKDIGNFSAFSSDAAEAGYADQTDARGAGTSEERKVLALEMIADQLALIHADLRSTDDFARADATGSGSVPHNGEDSERDRWDNEGGGLMEDALDSDITRSTEQHYAVGGYHYTNLQLAIAEAKRARWAAEQG